MRLSYLLAACGFFASVAAQTVVLPTLPTHYHTIISANIAEKGYTIGWEEWYDSSQGSSGMGLLRTDGKFATADISSIIDFSNDNDAVFSRTDTTVPCQIYSSISTIGSRSLFVNPITSVFQGFTNNPNLVFLGTATSSRGLLVNQYVATIGGQRSGLSSNATFSYTALLEYTIATATDPSVPLDVQFNGTRINYYPNGVTTTTTLNHYYTFLEWSQAPIDPSIFTRPTTCAFVTGLPSAQFRQNITSTVLPPGNLPLPFPQIPNSFTTFVEVKIDQSQEAKTYSVSTPKWSFSYVSNPLTRSERLDYYNATTQLFDFDVYNYFVVDANDYGRTFRIDNSQCTYGQIPSFTSSPLSEFRAGFVPELFSNSGSFSEANYLGRTMIRGVPADTWYLSQVTRTIGNTNYVFSSTMTFYPQGWQFPGRNYNDGVVPPMRVQNVGYQTTTGAGAVAYNDLWDFVLFIQTVPAASLFDSTQICPNAAPTQYPSGTQLACSSSNNNASVGAAVFFALLSLILAIVLIWFWWRTRKQGKEGSRPTGEHTQLSEQA